MSRELLLRALLFAAALAKFTQTKLDDEAVELLQSIAEVPEIYGFIEGLFKAWQSAGETEEAAGVLSLMSAPPASIAASVERKKINWKKLAENAFAIFQLLKTLQGK